MSDKEKELLITRINTLTFLSDSRELIELADIVREMLGAKPKEQQLGFISEKKDV